MEQVTLPVLPLRETVMFPGIAAPLAVGRAPSLIAVQSAIAGDRRLLALCQRENRDVVDGDDLYTVGTIARIAQVQKADTGMVLLLQGEDRARVIRLIDGGAMGLTATVAVEPDRPPANPMHPAFRMLHRELRLLSEEMAQLRGIPQGQLRELMAYATDPGEFSDLMAFYVEQEIMTKQRLLETLGVEDRLRALLPLVKRQVEGLRATGQAAQASQDQPSTGSGGAGGEPHTARESFIFISYRRESDIGYVVGRIYDRLIHEFGRDSVFKDVDSIPLGVDFREHIEVAVGNCTVFLAVISANWAERLQNPRDFVRIELEAALRRSVPVIPIFLQHATIPAEDALPATLQPLVYRNGLSVRPDPDFTTDMSRLVTGIRALVASS